MKRLFVLALGAAFALSAVQTSEAGLFDLFRSKRSSNGCCNPDPCCQPKKKCGLFGLFSHGKSNGCCEPASCCEPVSCCAPQPTCCNVTPACCDSAAGGSYTPSVAPKKPYEETPPVPKKDEPPPKPKKDAAKPKA